MSAPSTPRSRTATITHEHAIRVCVCGASGTVGSLTVHALAACGVNVAIRAACSASSLSSDVVNSYRSLYGGVDGAGGEGVEVVELDYQDVAGLERLLAGIDRVFVVLPWSRDLRSMFDNLLTAAKRANVNFVCKMSSAMALLNEQHDVKLPQFVADHAACDAALAGSGLAYAVVNTNVLFDNLLKFQAANVKKDRALVGLGGCASYIDARDIADCVLSVMLSSQRFHSRHLHVTGKEAVSGATIAEAMTRCYQTAIQYHVVSETEVRAVLERSGVPGWMSDDIVAMEHIREAGLLTAITPTVKETCGHPPRTLETFLSSYKSQLSPGLSIKQILNFFL